MTCRECVREIFFAFFPISSSKISFYHSYSHHTHSLIIAFIVFWCNFSKDKEKRKKSHSGLNGRFFVYSSTAALCVHSGQGSMALWIISDEKTLILPGWLTQQEQVCQSSGFRPPGALTTCPRLTFCPCTDTLLAPINGYNHFYWILFHIWTVVLLGVRSLLSRSGGGAADGPRCDPPSLHLLTAVADLFSQRLASTFL